MTQWASRRRVWPGKRSRIFSCSNARHGGILGFRIVVANPKPKRGSFPFPLRFSLGAWHQSRVWLHIDRFRRYRLSRGTRAIAFPAPACSIRAITGIVGVLPYYAALRSQRPHKDIARRDTRDLQHQLAALSASETPSGRLPRAKIRPLRGSRTALVVKSSSLPIRQI
jgi:hypothetical protein